MITRQHVGSKKAEAQSGGPHESGDTVGGEGEGGELQEPLGSTLARSWFRHLDARTRLSSDQTNTWPAASPSDCVGQ